MVGVVEGSKRKRKRVERPEQGSIEARSKLDGIF